MKWYNPKNNIILLNVKKILTKNIKLILRTSNDMQPRRHIYLMSNSVHTLFHGFRKLLSKFFPHPQYLNSLFLFCSHSLSILKNIVEYCTFTFYSSPLFSGNADVIIMNYINVYYWEKWYILIKYTFWLNKFCFHKNNKSNSSWSDIFWGTIFHRIEGD